MTQSSLWQSDPKFAEISELSTALYEREIQRLALMPTNSISSLQARLRSLPYYVNRTASRLSAAQTPLQLDRQNASWSAKQANKAPFEQVDLPKVWHWYCSFSWSLGLVIPIAHQHKVILDSIDRIDAENQRFRANLSGWFSAETLQQQAKQDWLLLKPSKAVFSAACCGHVWQGQRKLSPQMLSLRELLLSCEINWKNFKKPLNNVK